MRFLAPAFYTYFLNHNFLNHNIFRNGIVGRFRRLRLLSSIETQTVRCHERR